MPMTAASFVHMSTLISDTTMYAWFIIRETYQKNHNKRDEFERNLAVDKFYIVYQSIGSTRVDSLREDAPVLLFKVIDLLALITRLRCELTHEKKMGITHLGFLGAVSVRSIVVSGHSDSAQESTFE